MKAITINNSAVTIADNSLAKYIAEWISFADVKPSSQAAYNKALNRFFVYLRNNGIVQPDRVDVINFRDSLLLTCKPSTVQLYLTSVKLFFRFLAANGYYQNVADHVKSVKVDHEHKKDALTVEDSKRVLKQIDRTKPEGKRNVTIIALMMTCGLRSIEVVRANVGDIEKTQGKTFLKVHGKGRDGKVDRVLIPLQVENLINEYFNNVPDELMKTAKRYKQEIDNAMEEKRKEAYILAKSVENIDRKDLQKYFKQNPNELWLTVYSIRDNKPFDRNIIKMVEPETEYEDITILIKE